jgi:hypothetical protein
MKTILASFLFVTLANVAYSDPSRANADATPLHRENIEWCDVWYANANKTDKPAVLLIGDSISKGYGGTVEKGLAGKAYMARLSTSRGICDPVLPDEIRAMVRHHKFAVIHFNNGLHGADYTDAEYEAGYRKVLQVLQTEANGAKLILANTTLTRPGYPFPRERIEARNAIAARLAAEIGIPCNDLCAVTAEHPEYYHGDKIHYNGNGYAKLGEKVASAIDNILSGGGENSKN